VTVALGVRKLVAETLLAASGTSSRRYVDLCIEWYVGDARAPLATFGGRWDTQRQEYARAHPETCAVIRWHRAQEAASRWYIDWLADHLRARRLVRDGATQAAAMRAVYGDGQRVKRVLLFGGRGSGKSHWASGTAGTHAVAIPGARVVVLCPQLDHTVEIADAILGKVLPTEVRAYTAQNHTIELINGSRIELITAKGKRDCKIGSADLVIVNEAQEIPQQLIDDLLRLDTGGVQLLTLNPPRSAKGAWLVDFHEAIKAGEAPEGIQFYLDPRLNPHIPPDDFRDARRLLGEARYRREYLGDMAAPLTDVVFESYSDSVNRIDFVPSTWRDVTAAVAERWFEAPGAEWIIGADFDKRAGCTWVAGRFYAAPGARLERAAFVIEHAEAGIKGERQLAASLAAFERIGGYRTFHPDRTVIVGDASGAWQNTEREWERPPAFDHLVEDGWRVVKPQAHAGGNPRVWERLAAADLLLRRIPGAQGREPLVYVLSTARCVRDSLRYYPLKRNGEPDRRSQHAHPADAWTYVTWRRWGDDPAMRDALGAMSAQAGPKFVPRRTRNL
jgi:hypothetical protein